MERDGGPVLFLRTDNGAVDGVFKSIAMLMPDTSARQIAEFICPRLRLI
ncbi:hypothetical protein GGQ85_004379 [Nitrobacter vulgaris]|nr:hypothetical protein [Nitrobacter vulgaris]